MITARTGRLQEQSHGEPVLFIAGSANRCSPEFPFTMLLFLNLSVDALSLHFAGQSFTEIID